MNPEIKVKWLEALRSGEYTQTTGRLKRSEDDESSGFASGFCCLGVLCDLAHKEGIGDWDENNYYLTLVSYGVDKERSSLPGVISKWAGIAGYVGDLPTPILLLDEDDPGKEIFSLAAANDGGLSFLEIADIIEQQF